MVFLDFALVGLIGGLLAGGSFSALAETSIRGKRYAFAAIALQLAAFPSNVLPWGTSTTVASVLWIVSDALLIVMLVPEPAPAGPAPRRRRAREQPDRHPRERRADAGASERAQRRWRPLPGSTTTASGSSTHTSACSSTAGRCRMAAARQRLLGRRRPDRARHGDHRRAGDEGQAQARPGGDTRARSARGCGSGRARHAPRVGPRRKRGGRHRGPGGPLRMAAPACPSSASACPPAFLPARRVARRDGVADLLAVIPVCVPPQGLAEVTIDDRGPSRSPPTQQPRRGGGSPARRRLFG